MQQIYKEVWLSCFHYYHNVDPLELALEVSFDCRWVEVQTWGSKINRMTAERKLNCLVDAPKAKDYLLFGRWRKSLRQTDPCLKLNNVRPFSNLEEELTLFTKLGYFWSFTTTRSLIKEIVSGTNKRTIRRKGSEWSRIQWGLIIEKVAIMNVLKGFTPTLSHKGIASWDRVRLCNIIWCCNKWGSVNVYWGGEHDEIADGALSGSKESQKFELNRRAFRAIRYLRG